MNWKNKRKKDVWSRELKDGLKEKKEKRCVKLRVKK